MVRRIVTVAVGVILLTGTAAVAEEDVMPMIEKGKKEVSAKQYEAAIKTFQSIIATLQTFVEVAYETFFPGAQSGWEAGEIKSQSWAGTTDGSSHNMTNLTREYIRKSDNARLSVSITNWPTAVQGMDVTLKTYKQMAPMMANDPNTDVEFEEKGEWTILTIVDKQRGSANAHAVHEGFIVTFDFNRPEPGVTKSYVSSMKLSQLGKRSGG